jgi:hypothetical protein
MGAVVSTTTAIDREQYTLWTLRDVKHAVSIFSLSCKGQAKLAENGDRWPQSTSVTLARQLLCRREFFEAFCDSTARQSVETIPPVLTVGEFDAYVGSDVNSGDSCGSSAKSTKACSQKIRMAHVIIALALFCKASSLRERVEIILDLFLDDAEARTGVTTACRSMQQVRFRP